MIDAAMASLPLVVVSALLALRVSALRSVTAGIVVAVVLIATVFRDGADGVAPGLLIGLRISAARGLMNCRVLPESPSSRCWG